MWWLLVYVLASATMFNMNEEPFTLLEPKFTKLSSHIALQKISEKIVYESTIPLTYDTKWTNLEEYSTNVPFPICHTKNQWCNLMEKIQSVYKLTQDDLMDISNYEFHGSTKENENARDRRSLMSSFFGYCCGLVSKEDINDLYVGESKLAADMNSIFYSVDENHRQLLSVASSAKTMANQSNSFLELIRNFQKFTIAIEKGMDQEQRILIAMTIKNTINIFKSLESQRKTHIISTCKEKKIPHIIVPISTLVSDLRKLENQISTDGYTLAIHPDQISVYYSTEITKCIISPNHIAIKIQVPILKKNIEYSLYQTFSVPFAWEDYTCKSEMENQLIVNTKSVEHVFNVLEEECKNGLCYIQRIRTDSNNANCFKSIFKKQYHKLIQVCKMKCEQNNQTRITQIKEDHFILTHPSNITEIRCRDQKFKPENDIKHGALEIYLPCICQIWDNETLYVDVTYPCDSKVTKALKLSHVLPQQFSKYYATEMLKEVDLVIPMARNITNIISPNWTFSQPEFNLDMHIRKLPFSITEILSSHSKILVVIVTAITSSTFLVFCIIVCLRKFGCNVCKRQRKQRATVIFTTEKAKRRKVDSSKETVPELCHIIES